MRRIDAGAAGKDGCDNLPRKKSCVDRLHSGCEIGEQTSVFVFTANALAAPAPGRYRVTAAAAGFEGSTREEVVVAARQETMVGFAPAIGQSNSVIEVSGPAAPIGVDGVLTDRGGNLSQAAKLLGLHRRPLQRKLYQSPPRESP